MRLRWWAPVVVLAVVLAVATGCRPEIQSFSLTGTVDQPSSVVGRDIGISAQIESQVVWLFGDTVLAAPGCDGTQLRDSTAALGTLESITAVTEPVDSCGAPFALVSPGVPTTPTGARTAFWPSSIVPTADGRAAVWYDQMLIDGDTWTRQATSVDEMESGATTLDRTNETVLFGADEPSYSTGNLVDDGFIYVYATLLDADLRSSYSVARVPEASYRVRAEYTYWDGAGWTADIRSATRIRARRSGSEASGGLGGMTVSYNPWLGKYLMVHGEAWKQDLMLRSASRPEGPWSEPTHVDVPDSTADNPFGAYTVREHPEFRSADGRTVELTYIRSTGWLQSQLPVVRVTFK